MIIEKTLERYSLLFALSASTILFDIPNAFAIVGIVSCFLVIYVSLALICVDLNACLSSFLVKFVHVFTPSFIKAREVVSFENNRHGKQ